MITGGAGYIGSHVVRALVADRQPVVVLDDLSTGDPERLPEGVPLVRGSILDRPLLDRVLREHEVRGIVHDVSGVTPSLVPVRAVQAEPVAVGIDDVGLVPAE